MERSIEAEDFWYKELPQGIKDDEFKRNWIDENMVDKTYPWVKLGEVSLLKDLVLVLPN